SVARKVRSITMPFPPMPCTDPFCGETIVATTGAAGTVVVVAWGSDDLAGVPDFLPELHAARMTRASASKGSRRRMGADDRAGPVLDVDPPPAPAEVQPSSRSSSRTVTVSPACFEMARR